MKEKQITEIDEEEYFTRLVTIIQTKVNELEKKCDELQEYYYQQIDLGFNPKVSPRLISLEKDIQRLKGRDEAYIEMLLQFVKVRDKLRKKKLKELRKKE